MNLMQHSVSKSCQFLFVISQARFWTWNVTSGHVYFCSKTPVSIGTPPPYGRVCYRNKCSKCTHYFRQKVFLCIMQPQKRTWEHAVWCMGGNSPMFFFMSHSSSQVLIYCIYLTWPLHIWEYRLNIFFPSLCTDLSILFTAFLVLLIS